MSRDRRAGWLLLAISIFVYYQSLFLKKPSWVPVGPAFAPKFGSICLAILSIILILGKHLSSNGVEEPTPKSEGTTASAGRKLKLLILLLLFLYVVFLPIIGYFPSTLIFLLIAMWLLGKRTPQSFALSGIVAALSILGIYLVFQKVMYIWLPSGVIFQ